MSDSIPNAEQQVPSIEEIFSNLSGLPAEKQVPALAAIVQAVVGQLAEVDQRVQEVCSKHDDLDREIHEDFFGPIHQQYQASVRGKGIEDLKGRYPQLSELNEPMGALEEGFDIYGRLYDYLEELKKGEGWAPENEGSVVEGIHKSGMDMVNRIRGKKDEPAAEEKPATAVEVSVEKAPAATARSKFAKGKGLLAGM